MRDSFMLAVLLQLTVPAGAEAVSLSGPSTQPSATADVPTGSTAAAPHLACVPARPDLPGRTARLVAAYGFEETSGNTTRDASGNSHPGMLINAVLTTGRFGNGLDLDGTTGHLRIDDPQWPTADYTYAAWVFPRTSSSWGAMVEIQTPASRGVELAITSGGRLEVWSSQSPRFGHSVPLAPRNWTHVALTRAEFLITLFVDGVAHRAGRDGTTFDFGTCPALIGVDADSGCTGKLNGFFEGVIDELKVYDCALSAAGIRSIMNVPVEPFAQALGRPDAATGQAQPRSHTVLTMPPQWDLWILAYLAALLAQFPDSISFVQQGVGPGVLGGVWYATALFLLWFQGAQPGQRDVRRRMLTLVLGSLVAALLTVLAPALVSWPPPSAHPELAGLYPENLAGNLNPNSFPSQSTALYAAISAGIYSLRKTLGVSAWIGVGVLVALPRMYLGGHYVADVLAGLIAGVGGYWISVWLCQPKVVPLFEAFFEHRWDDWRRTLAESAVFVWILQVATEFSLARWITNAVNLVSLGLGTP